MNQEQKAKKSAYDQKYMKENIIRKLIAFNMTNERDVEIFRHLKQQKNTTEYIKGLIWTDMGRE